MDNLSEEERLRRAEEVAYRRQNRIPVDEITTHESQDRKLTRFGKFSLQIIVSICLFGVVYFVNERYSFALDKIKPVMNDDTDFVKMYQTINYVFKNIADDYAANAETNDKQNSLSGEKNSGVINENISDNKASIDNKNSADNKISVEEINSNGSNLLNDKNNLEKNQIQNNDDLSNKDSNENSDGDTKNSSGNNENESSNQQDDVKYIKSNFSFIKPVEGIISSRFGEREATEVVSANHQGIDIAVNTGTDVKASMKGKVKEVSIYGDYGTHIIIENEDVITLYAHLSEALVSEGEEIEQGRVIAKTGSTGKSTGPHLHFEIRRNNVAVNPQDILEF